MDMNLVKVPCVMCGNNIGLNEARFIIGNSNICYNCATDMTVVDLFNEDKIPEIKYFDGEAYDAAGVGPEDEGDTGVEFIADVPVNEYDRYVQAWEEKNNPNKMSNADYEHYFFEGGDHPLLNKTQFESALISRNYEAVLRSICGDEIKPGTEQATAILDKIFFNK